MSCQRMPVVEQTGPGRRPGHGSSWPSPPRCRAPRRPGSSCGWPSTRGARSPGSGPVTRSAGTTSRPRSRSAAGNEAVLLLDEPGRLLGPEVPDLSGFTVAGEPVRWLWLIPITSGSGCSPQSAGPSSLVNQLASQRRSWVVVARLAASRASRAAAARRMHAGRRSPVTSAGRRSSSAARRPGPRSAASRSGPARRRGRAGSMPMSLMSRSRLIIDSTRSPSVAAATAAAPSSSPCQTGRAAAAAARWRRPPGRRRPSRPGPPRSSSG